MTGWLRRLLVAVVIAAVVALVAWAFVPEPEAVEVGEVTRGEMRITIEDEGQTRVRERYTVTAPLAGRLSRITLREGDMVEAGDILARIAPERPALLDARTRSEAQALLEASRATVAEAQAGVERAEAELDFARYERQRIEQLYEQNVTTRQELERVVMIEQSQRSALDAAQWGERIAEHRLEQAQAVLDVYDEPNGLSVDLPMEVMAPVDGAVLRIADRSARFVTPGTPILEMADVGQLEVVVDVLSDNASRIAAGDEAEIVQWTDQRIWRAVVRRVEPGAFTEISALGVEEQRVNVIVDFVDETPRWPGIGDGYRMDVRVITWKADDVLRVPAAALFRDADRWAVFRIVNERAQLQPVELGQRTPHQAEVIAGLEEGEQIILYPTDRISEGTRISPRQ